MGESMVLIRTYPNETEAGSAQEELRASGIQSLLFSEETESAAGGVHLAVHQRDQTIAEAVLKAVMNAEDRPSGLP